MRNAIISVILLVVLMLYIGHVSISIKPFSFSLPYWHRSVGLFLIIVGFIIFNIGEHAKGYADGLKKGGEITKEVIEQVIKDNSKKK